MFINKDKDIFLSVDITLTWPAPALIVSAIFAFDVKVFSSYFIMDLVVAIHFDMRVYDGHHLERTEIQWIEILYISEFYSLIMLLHVRLRFR